ncbi:hypothetical protein AJ79_03348 [Helicocarpus griseus UAMH5409]|uniref:Uncharacterized protein n=1 Tax=Helicocarpus griseus UAMH5409 TaxID=1447875 RepID=A0A2B7XYS7_9EURO|nr:hypothetical protein AJ79_03348 [Helicocarpus griseus UAMH5409]
MKLLSFLVYALVAVSGVIASPINNSLEARGPDPDHATLAERQSFLGLQTGNIKIFRSKNTSVINTQNVDFYRFRVLGGLRVLPHLASLWDNVGGQLAKAFFQDFSERFQRMSNVGFPEVDAYALYKDTVKYGAIVGMQFRLPADSIDETKMKTIIRAFNQYFADNNHCPVSIEDVENAWTIGGPLQLTSVGTGQPLNRRADVCSGLDLVSQFRPDIFWNSITPLHAVEPC